MSESVDCVVIGAGVVGLAVARELALLGREVIVLESQQMIGSGISSRNSEVIHAGIYYPKDSLKARFCVEGRDRLYDHCRERPVGYRRCGKLIVATHPDQLPELRNIAERAKQNGVNDLQWMDAEQVSDLEPEITAVAALHSPSTGIISSHDLMLSLQGEAEASGAMIAFNSPVVSGAVHPGNIELEVEGDETVSFNARTVINAAGLGAIPVAKKLRGLDQRFVPEQQLAKGSYFRLEGSSPVSRLIYPMPEMGGLGVHITLDLAGQARFGPDVEWIDELDYEVDGERAEKFYRSIRRYWPDLGDDSLQPDYAGIRPKIKVDGEIYTDFMISGPETHGVKGLIHLFGIESPGLTSCLAIARYVGKLT